MKITFLHNLTSRVADERGGGGGGQKESQGLELVSLSVPLSHCQSAIFYGRYLSYAVVAAAALTTKVAIKRHKICVPAL